MRLNGWQRLWVVVSTITIVITSIFIYEGLPIKNEIEKEWAYSLLEIVKKPNEIASLILDAYKDLSSINLVQKITAKYGIKKEYKEDLSSLNSPYKNKIKKLVIKRTEYIINYLILWGVFIGILYLLGFAIGWIYKGFKPPSNENELFSILFRYGFINRYFF